MRERVQPCDTASDRRTIDARSYLGRERRSTVTYIRNQIAVVTFVEDEAMIAQIIAFREQMPEELQRFLVGPIVGGNFWITFAMMPAGSSERSLREWRLAFLALLQDLHVRKKAQWADGSSPDIVQLRFGGDVGGTVIEDTTDETVMLSSRVAMKYSSDMPHE